MTHADMVITADAVAPLAIVAKPGLGDAQVTWTMVGGKVTYASEGAAQ